MRLAVFSDVHGNIDALRAVLRAIGNHAVDAHVFCGDICGYYYEQEAVISELRRLPNLVAVRGNHDAHFLGIDNDPASLEALVYRYGSTYRRLRNVISSEARRFLAELPESFVSSDGTWAVYHGSPWNPLEEYVYPDSDLRRFASLPFRFVFLGHTHRPLDQRAGNVRIVNPGSCGQPRDEWKPSFALVDLAKDTVDIRRVGYDASALKAAAVERDPDIPYLRTVLERGRAAP